MTDPSASSSVPAWIVLVQAIVWPITLLFVIIHFSKPLRNFLDRLTQLNVGKEGITLSAGLEFVKSMQAAIVKSSVPADDRELASRAEADVEEAVDAVSSMSQTDIKNLSRARVLWVDDRPDNNRNERRAMEAFGVKFTLCKSTDEALSVLGRQNFDAIISDMGRPEGARAGYDLLDRMQKTGIDTPFIVYAGADNPEVQRETRSRGGFGTTNRPQKLFDLVRRAVQVRPV